MVEVRQWRIRPAGPGDIEAIAALDRGESGSSWSALSYAGELKLAWSHLEVALSTQPGDDAALAGALVYWIVTDEVQLLNILTAPHLRRKGLGRFMMEHLFERARAASAVRITLEVRATNGAAIALYIAFGFREVGVRQAYYRRGGEDAVLMEAPV